MESLACCAAFLGGIVVGRQPLPRQRLSPPRGGELHQILLQRLHGGQQPYVSHEWLLPEDHSYPHTNVPVDFLRALFGKLRPKYLVELGSFKGGSALRICSALEDEAALVCIDTFLGDSPMWLQHGGLMLQGGQPQLYAQFMANTKQHAKTIVPFPIASLCGLRALEHLAAEGATPMVDFIYLDSAHLQGETLLEITSALQLLRPGGVLSLVRAPGRLGDDLDWPAVEADLSSFLAAHPQMSQSAEDEHFRSLPCVFFFTSGGYWVVEACPRQWLLRKGADPMARQTLQAQLRRAEDGEHPAEYVPASPADEEALRLYETALARMAAGEDAAKLMKAAAQLSPSLKYHFQL